jgi:putative NIF3 family GTP cyclohydrolase 1 type 2
MIDALGWEKYRNADNPRLYTMPATTLDALARDIQKRMELRVVRVIGDPKMTVRNAAFSPGFGSLQAAVRTLERPEVDVLVLGEPREWEGVPYVQDAITAGQKKAMIIMGHASSEESGMKECAKWLKTFITEVPVEYVPAGEPYWSPK